MKDVIYFELNNWSAGEHYPWAEPFITWLGDDGNLYFSNEEWVSKQDITVTECFIDMSVNYCIGAPKEWVENNCPELLTKYTNFIMKKNEDDELVGRSFSPVIEYTEENKGKIFRFEEHFSRDKGIWWELL